jgi:hypothetical protein
MGVDEEGKAWVEEQMVVGKQHAARRLVHVVALEIDHAAQVGAELAVARVD